MSKHANRTQLESVLFEFPCLLRLEIWFLPYFFRFRKQHATHIVYLLSNSIMRSSLKQVFFMPCHHHRHHRMHMSYSIEFENIVNQQLSESERVCNTFLFDQKLFIHMIYGASVSFLYLMFDIVNCIAMLFFSKLPRPWQLFPAQSSPVWLLFNDNTDNSLRRQTLNTLFPSTENQ